MVGMLSNTIMMYERKSGCLGGPNLIILLWLSKLNGSSNDLTTKKIFCLENLQTKSVYSHLFRRAFVDFLGFKVGPKHDHEECRSCCLDPKKSALASYRATAKRLRRPEIP